ncbi:MAG TPA: zinc-binding dehydrogenase, partial [Pseudonocardia sp.]|uniref:zinc-binding dehydrogenase n=1 Tax=Pseudonocardia sp. TaxID=60912 RepID=UPI002ED7BE9A
AAAPDLVDQARRALGDGADVVLDCVSGQSSMAQAIELVDKGGTVMVVGIAAGPTTIPLHLVQDREIAVIGSLMYVQDDVRRAIDLLAGGAVAAEDLVTATFPLERAAEAFAASIAPDQLKVLVSVAGSG